MIRTEVLTTRDAERWRAVLPADVSAMGSVEVARILERQTGAEARLFVAELDGAAAAYPFLVRPVRGLPFANGLSRFSDTFTAEYSGPRWLGPGAPDDPGDPRGPRFAQAFAAHCREAGIVAEFAHLSPWTPPGLLDAACVQENREIVWIDLTWGEAELWKRSLTSDARRNVRQAQRAGVLVRRAASREDVAAFHRLFDATMARRNALERYRYPLEYFTDLFEALPANAFIALAEDGGRVVAGGVFLHDATDVVWHLSALDMDAAAVRPVNAYLHETIAWAARAGKRRMLCGGGYQPNDGVARFKAGFSPLRARFCTYQRVHDADAYDALARAWSAHHGGASAQDFFPAYRCGERAAPAPDHASAAALQERGAALG